MITGLQQSVGCPGGQSVGCPGGILDSGGLLSPASFLFARFVGALLDNACPDGVADANPSPFQGPDILSADTSVHEVVLGSSSLKSALVCSTCARILFTHLGRALVPSATLHFVFTSEWFNQGGVAESVSGGVEFHLVASSTLVASGVPIPVPGSAFWSVCVCALHSRADRLGSVGNRDGVDGVDGLLGDADFPMN